MTMPTDTSSTDNPGTLSEQLARLQEDNVRLQNELADMNLMYENMMEHGVAIEDQLADRNVELERMQKRLANELSEAANYVQSIIPAPLAEYPVTQWRYVPSSELGGDSFGYYWIDPDHFAMYLLDVCGHGVGAALLSVTAINVLRSGALPAVDMRDPGQVLTGMNNAFDMAKQNDMYFTLWYGVFQRSTRRLKFASGGHPPALLVSCVDGSPVVKELITRQMVIGAMPGDIYEMDSCVVPPDGRLFVFSDGTYEIQKPGQTDMLTLEEYAQYIAKMPRGSSYGLDDLIADLRKVQGHPAFEDDFSIFQVDL